MTTSGPSPEATPRNWCTTCGKPLYERSMIYKFASLYGPAIACGACAGKKHGYMRATWDDVLIGYRDIKRWKK